MSEKQKEEKKIEIINNKKKLKFDLLKITSIIEKEGQYKERDSIFEFYKEYNKEQDSQNNDIDVPQFFVHIKSENCVYMGVLSQNLKKEVYGYNLFENGDEYFGKWNKDKKDAYGIYYFKEKEDSQERQIYIGEFSNNIKQGEGVYLKIKNFEKENQGRPDEFIFAFGKFTQDNFKEGIIYAFEDGKEKIYKGKLNEEGKKEDDKAIIYENGNQLFCGKIKNNIMMEGRIIIFKEGSDEKEEAYYFQRKEEKSPDDEVDFDYRKKEESDEELIKQMKEILNIFDREKLKELYMKVMEYKEKIKGPDNFEYMKNIDFDNNVKGELRNMYGKFIYLNIANE